MCNNGVSPYQTRKEAHVSEKHQPHLKQQKHY